MGRPPRGGAGSASPQGAHGLHRGMCPVGQGPLASSSGQNGTPRHSWGLTTRTRRPRPSEKITLRIVSRSSPQGHPSLHSPPPGGTGSASPQRGHWLRGGYSPLGSRPLAHASGGNGMPWRSFSLAMRTHRVRPSEKTSLGAIPWFAPVRPFSHRLAIWRRGGLRTPAKEASPSATRITVRPPAHRHRTGWERNASAFPRPYHAGAQSAPLGGGVGHPIEEDGSRQFGTPFGELGGGKERPDYGRSTEENPISC